MIIGEHKTTMVDTIYSNIRKDIAQRYLRPGQKINVKELSDRYGTSETPVKLALNRLVTENIIEHFPRQGMQVKLVSVEEIEEIIEMRMMLDLFYTKEIIKTVNYNEDLRDRLAKNVHDHMRMISDPSYVDSPDAYLENYRYDEEFHDFYLKCSGSKKIVEIFHYINPFLYANYTYGKQSRERDIEGVREHEAILNAILGGDEQALRKAVIDHNMSTKQTVSLILKVNKLL